MNLKILTNDNETIAVEDKGDGTVTSWGYTVWGPLGTNGKPKEGSILREPKNKKERELIDRAQKLIDRSMKSQQALYLAMGGKNAN